MIDFHNHLIPGVDDGATDLAQALDGLKAMESEGVHTIITTPHFEGSLTHNPDAFAARMAELDTAWNALSGLVETQFPLLRLARGVEVRLDTPDPDLSDARLRLGGSSFVLVEFDRFTIPPGSTEALFKLKRRGITPILAHPERYSGIRRGMDLVEEWRKVGCYLQVNSGSLLGRYGDTAYQVALKLLERGCVDYLSSDYHARGRPAVRQARDLLLDMGGEEQAELLTLRNPGRILNNEPPLDVPPLQPRRAWWRRLQKIFR